MSSDSFASRWGLSQDEPSERLRKFKNRLLLIIGDNPDTMRSHLLTLSFMLGEHIDTFGGIQQFGGGWYFRAKHYFDTAVSTPVVAQRIEVLLNLDIISEKQKLAVVNMIESNDIGIRVAKIKNDKWYSYPAGEKILDKEAVEKPLRALDKKSALEYAKALGAYSRGEWDTSADKTRHTLEEYLRHLLGNTKGLKSNIEELARVAKQQNVPSHLRKVINNGLRSLDDMYNENSKHDTKISGEHESEYLIYQVGIMINLLSKLDLKKEE